jgi:flagellar biosynthesis/type III secretory pathway protein FliH
MTSFRPLWSAKAADHGEDVSPADARPSAPIGFQPVWLGGGKRDFVLTQLKAGKLAKEAADQSAERDDQVQSQVLVGEPESVGTELDSMASAEFSEAATKNTDAVPRDNPPGASAVFVQAPPPIPMICCEEHNRLLEIERAAGLEAGRLEGRAEAAAIIDAERETMRAYLASIEAGFGNSVEFFAPLKKLALHIAQQLVRGELLSAGAVVSRLIDRCLELAGDRKPLAIRLHPQDAAMFRKLRGDDSSGLPLEEDASFVPGSVRVVFNDGWIEDMMSDRVDEIARALRTGATSDVQPSEEKS